MMRACTHPTKCNMLLVVRPSRLYAGPQRWMADSVRASGHGIEPSYCDCSTCEEGRGAGSSDVGDANTVIATPTTAKTVAQMAVSRMRCE